MAQAHCWVVVCVQCMSDDSIIFPWERSQSQAASLNCATPISSIVSRNNLYLLQKYFLSQLELRGGFSSLPAIQTTFFSVLHALWLNWSYRFSAWFSHICRKAFCSSWMEATWFKTWEKRRLKTASIGQHLMTSENPWIHLLVHLLVLPLFSMTLKK